MYRKWDGQVSLKLVYRGLAEVTYNYYATNKEELSHTSNGNILDSSAIVSLHHTCRGISKFYVVLVVIIGGQISQSVLETNRKRE